MPDGSFQWYSNLKAVTYKQCQVVIGVYNYKPGMIKNDVEFMKFLHVSRKVETRIKSLAKDGKAGRTLAEKATSIIDGLSSGLLRADMDSAGSVTKYGEKRIRNCRKYDLGCGYRLICLKRGSDIYIPFMGSHDDCQRWLEKHRRLKDIHPGTGKTICIEETRSTSMASEEQVKMKTSQDDADLDNPISESDLRRVFSGLTKNSGSRL